MADKDFVRTNGRCAIVRPSAFFVRPGDRNPDLTDARTLCLLLPSAFRVRAGA